MDLDAPARAPGAPGAGARPVAGLDEARRLFPWRAVVLPWLVSRAVSAVVVVVAGSSGARVRFAGFFAWDGGWYEHIARFGYGPPPPDDVQTPWP
ncbi:MAG TPA: hypothetical protein VF152_10145, partial [Acidimicrobiia bacterium]